MLALVVNALPVSPINWGNLEHTVGRLVLTLQVESRQMSQAVFTIHSLGYHLRFL